MAQELGSWNGAWGSISTSSFPTFRSSYILNWETTELPGGLMILQRANLRANLPAGWKVETESWVVASTCHSYQEEQTGLWNWTITKPKNRTNELLWGQNLWKCRRKCRRDQAFPPLFWHGVIYNHTPKARKWWYWAFYLETLSIYVKILMEDTEFTWASWTGLSLIFFLAIQWKSRSVIRKIQNLHYLYYLNGVKEKWQPSCKCKYCKTLFLFFDRGMILEVRVYWALEVKGGISKLGDSRERGISGHSPSVFTWQFCLGPILFAFI